VLALSGAGASIAILACPSVAWADAEDDARSAMRRGVSAFGRGDAEAALAEYEAAKRLVPTANAPYRYAAEALSSLGRWPEAVKNLEAYLAMSPGVSDGADVADRIARIKAEHYPSHVRIVADADGALVSVDGDDRGAPGSLDLPPGRHRIAVRAPSRASAAQEVTLVGDRDATLVFALPPAPPPKSAASEPPAPEPPASPRWRTAGAITFGVGAATFVTALVLDLALVGPAVSDYRAAADRADPAARDLRDDASSLQTAVLVTYVASAVLTLAGGSAFLLAPRQPASNASLRRSRLTIRF